MVHTADGRAVWYTGMQSQRGGDRETAQGTMGFVMTDTRTGQTRFYPRSGVTEAAAAEVMEGEVQEKDYTATWQIPYVVGGVPTYISVLKDRAGNPQMIGMVAYDDRTLVAVEETLSSTLRRYSARLRERGTALALEGGAEIRTFEGEVVRLGDEPDNERVMWLLTLAGVENKAFRVSSQLGAEVLLTEPGDRVRISALDASTAVVDVAEFDNLELEFERTEAQQLVDERREEAESNATRRQNRRELEQRLDGVDGEALERALEALEDSQEATRR